MPSEMKTVLSNSETITQKLRSFGFAYISLDLQGYRTGSMNEVIQR